MRAISKFKRTKQTSSSCSSCELNMKLADFKSYMYSFVVIAWQRNDPGGGGTLVFFGWVCAARGSKLAPRSKKKFP